MGQYRIGELNEQITIQQQVEGANDPAGYPTITWSDYLTCFAAIRPLKSRERFRADRFISEDFRFFVIRWVSGITHTMRISYNDGTSTRYFNIRGIVEIDERRRRFLEIVGEAEE